MKRNQKNGAITVSALSSSRTFADRKELERYVAALIDFGPLELAAKQMLAWLNGGGTSRIRAIAPPPKPPTPFNDRVAVLDQEEEGAGTVYAESKEAWLSRLQESRVEFGRRLSKARGSTAKLGRFQAWRQERAAELASLEFAFRKADRRLQRARARANAMRIARDRWIQEQAICLVYEGQEVSLAEFMELQELEGR